MFTLDPYAARSCALKTHHAFHPGVVRPATAIPQARMPGSAEFTAGTYARILAGRAGVVDLRDLLSEPNEAQEDACLAAMDAGAEVIIGGLLPRDWEGHRSSRADLLVRSTSGGYYPGLVKFQRVVDARKDDFEFIYSELDDLPSRCSTTGRRYRWHWRWANTLQLAHLWRHLTALGRAAASEPAGLVIGNDDAFDQVACWLDLDESSCPPAPTQVNGAAAEGVAQVTPLERYDHDFALRVGLAERASAADPDDPPLLKPIVCYECSYCPWWSYCRSELDDDDLSLRINKSPLDGHEISVLRESGVATVADLAKIDLDALLPAYLSRVVHRTGAEDRLRLAQRRSQLLVNGVELERTLTGPIEIPQARVEIDIDVETSKEDRVYLWGFWVSEPGDGGYYREFSSFTDLDEAGELALARQAMTWLREIAERDDALVFHYSDYEVVRLTRLAKSGDEALRWAVGYAREHFVDLFATVRKHYFGTNGLGLKVVASAGAGFHWRDDDPGGLNSMRWFDEAVHAPSAEARQLARTRVLEYNEDDVLATWQLRRWLREQP